MYHLDFARVLLSLVMLGYASWIDLKTREIYDLVWMVFGGIGLLLAAYEVYFGDVSLIGLLIQVVSSAVMAILMGYVGLFGGADVGAFITLAILNPYPPMSIEPMLGIVSIIYPITLFSNSALSGASFAFILLAKNLSRSIRGEKLFEGQGTESPWKRLIVMVTGLKVGLDRVRGPPFQYPLELPSGSDEYGRRLVLLPDINDDRAAEEIFLRLRGEGVDQVWVSHTLPFIVFIFLGYVLTILVGDIALSVIIRFFLR